MLDSIQDSCLSKNFKLDFTIRPLLFCFLCLIPFLRTPKADKTNLWWRQLESDFFFFFFLESDWRRARRTDGKSSTKELSYPLSHYSRPNLLPAMQETQKLRVRFLGWEGPLKKEMETHSSILAWRIRVERGAWQATVHSVAKSRTQLNDWACKVIKPNT